jgi:hypothetical protein
LFAPLKFMVLFLKLAVESLKYDPPSHDLIKILGHGPKTLLLDKIPVNTVNA